MVLNEGKGAPKKKTSEMLINTWENHYSGVKMRDCENIKYKFGKLEL